MKKVIVLIAAAGLACSAQAGMFTPNSDPAAGVISPEDILTVTFIQTDDFSAYIVCLEPASPAEGSAGADVRQQVQLVSDLRYLPGDNTVVTPDENARATIRLFPEPTTIVLLGLCGLLIDRRRKVRSLPSRI
jgi:hypothetical protein